MRISDWSSDVCSSDLHFDTGFDKATLDEPVLGARSQHKQHIDAALLCLLLTVFEQAIAATAATERMVHGHARQLRLAVVWKRIKRGARSAERRVGQERVRTLRSRWLP